MNLGSIASRMPTTFDPPLDCSPATLAGCHASVRALFDYWWAKRGTRQMPARGDIDPTELKALLPHLILIDVVPDARRYVYRLVGTHEVEMRGGDPTGKTVKDAFYAESADHTISFLDHVTRTRAPALYRGTYQPTSTRTQTEDTIFLPLSHDGAAVNMILVYGHIGWLRDENKL